MMLPILTVLLVNKAHPLSKEYIPEDLRAVHIPFVSTNPIEKTFLRNEAAHALESLYLDACLQGLTIKGVSGYRSYDRQAFLYESYCSQLGEKEASRISAQPGMSEHQTGLAIDLSCHSINYELNESFGKTKEGQWLSHHSYEYGFIIRYPQGKENITGYAYEPWHLRYVGIELASELYRGNHTLEEYCMTKKLNVI